MVYEFAGFELDPKLRELRLSGRGIALQPRVFQLLLYLVDNRERVVSKEELLERVWTDAVVSDGSLKRAVSLLRSALRQGGCEDAIRTYARQGYRFDAADLRETSDATGAAVPAVLAGARAAYADERWADAARELARADADGGLEAPDLERWAEAEQCAGHPWSALPVLERAFAAHSTAGDSAGAARAALGLAHIHYERMEMSVGRGWLQRARSVLPATDDGSREHGLLAAFDSRFAIADGEHDVAVARAERAVAIGRDLDDIDVELLGLSFLGIARTARGDVAGGVAAHEEAAASVLAGACSPRVSGIVYCGMIWTCRNRGDWQRAAEWAESFNRWCQQSSLETFGGTCRLHHAEVLHQRGELDEAEREVLEACELLADLAPYARGDGRRVLGDLRLAQGDLDAAEEEYRRAHELGWDPQPGLALVMVARGQAPAALRALDRSLAAPSWANRQRRGLLLANMVTVALAAGEPERAAQAMAELDALIADSPPSALVAEGHQARAALRAHDGDLDAAIAELREAIRRWHQVGAPLRAARSRLRLAELFVASGDAEAAELELSAARQQLASLNAANLAGEVDRLAEMLDSPAG